MIAVSLLLVSLPIALPSGRVFAQTTGYSVTQVDHQVTVMYSGQVVIQDTIHVSGQITDGFLIGMPFTYSTDILKAVAYDSNNVYQVNLGVQLGNKSGFYGAEVNFNGASPSVFTVAFVLSRSLITQIDARDYTLNFPAYPSLTQNAASCNVTITLPSAPLSINITKSDGEINAGNYVVQNLPAYTYSPASATIKVANGTIQLTDVSQLNRQITIDPTGKISASDSYDIINNSTSTMAAFILDLPENALNILVKDESGTLLTTHISSSTKTGIFLVNTTLVTSIASGQSAIIIASYNLPGSTIQGSQYTLSNFKLFPDFNYYVDHATCTFNPPEGATLLTPQLSSADSSSSLTRGPFQDALTITRDGISFVDYSLPEGNNVQLSYNYNPVWVSFLPTFWVSLIAVIGCVGAAIYQKRKPSEKEPIKTRREKWPTPKPTTAASAEQAKSTEPMSSQRITPENLREFTDAYDDKKRLNAEIRLLDARAQKGKIPRRQYKVQRKAIEIRVDSLTRNTSRLKDVFRSSGSAYADLIKQLDSAEADLAEAENNIKSLESTQSKGGISMEAYKKNIADYQKRKDKAESAINGILLRLREKAR
jgi:hypothetical protein